MSETFKHAEVVGPFTEPEWSYAVVNTHIGEDSKPFNPFATRMIGIG